VVLIYGWFSRIPEPEVKPVDWRPVVAQAQAQAPYPVAVPQNLPDTWAVVRARWTPLGQPGLDQAPAVGNTFQLGYLTPQQIYIGLDQRDVDPQGIIRTASRDGAADGEACWPASPGSAMSATMTAPAHWCEPTTAARSLSAVT